MNRSQVTPAQIDERNLGVVGECHLHAPRLVCRIREPVAPDHLGRCDGRGELVGVVAHKLQRVRADVEIRDHIGARAAGEMGKPEGIRPRTAGNGFAAAADSDDVVARPAQDRGGASAADQTVVAGATDKSIARAGAAQRGGGCAGTQEIVARGAALEIPPARSAGRGDGARAAHHGGGGIAADECQFAGAAKNIGARAAGAGIDGRGPARRLDRVAARDRHDTGAAAERDRIVAKPGHQGFTAAARDETVISDAADQRISAPPAAQRGGG